MGAVSWVGSFGGTITWIFGVEELAGFSHAWTIDICLVIPILWEAETGKPRVQNKPGLYSKGLYNNWTKNNENSLAFSVLG